MKEEGRPRSPVTMAVAIAWCLIFGWMVVVQGTLGLLLDPGRLLLGSAIQTPVSHLFGDVTPREIYAGQVWRGVTATFVHFNLIHLGLNLAGLVQLGRLLESWYGSGRFAMVYLVIGGLGNLGANLLRPWLGTGPGGMLLHSGGGSTVVLGLVGLVTVVGWRNPAEFPRRARWWLAGLLLFNALLGVMIPRIDNLGHAAGAVVGAGLGLADRRWLRERGTWRSRVAGGLAGLTIVASLGLMIVHQVREVAAGRAAARGAALMEALARFQATYDELFVRRPGMRPALRANGPLAGAWPLLVLPAEPEAERRCRDSLRDQLRGFRNVFAGVRRPAEATAVESIGRLASRALSRTPTEEEWKAFRGSMLILLSAVDFERDQALRRYRRLNEPVPWIAVRLGWRAGSSPGGAAPSPAEAAGAGG